MSQGPHQGEAVARVPSRSLGAPGAEPCDCDGLSRGHVNGSRDQIDQQKEDCTMIKRALDPEQLEAQTAFELPDREVLALVNVVITDLLNGNTITVDVSNVHVAATICAVVDLLNTLLAAPTLSCTTMA